MSLTAQGKNILNETSRIRYGTSKDAELLSELGARTFCETFAEQNTKEDMAAYLAEAFSVNKQAAELADANVTFLIAEAGDKPRGYAKLLSGPAPNCVTADTPVEISRIYVAKESIGKGIGAQLMFRCMEAANERGFRTIWLGVWERNERAQNFYRNWGFKVVGNQSFLLGSDLQNDYVMERSL
jgi:ribosomal protein S18 acetylase RimI-like enzyme